MAQALISIQRIKLEATQAAAKYTDVNDACPYPWGSSAAVTFKREFEAARAIRKMFCECHIIPTAGEIAIRRCIACGKELLT